MTNRLAEIVFGGICLAVCIGVPLFIVYTSFATGSQW